MIVPPALGAPLCALAVLFSSASTGSLPGQDPEQVDVKTDAPTFMGWSYILEADLAAGRRAGTLAPETTDAQALEQIAEALRFRLVGSGKFVEGQVAIEPEGRLAVTFVGKMGEAYDKLLIAGLSNSGRLVCFGRAFDDELPEGREAERARFAAWRAAHPELAAWEYDRVPREEGGPAPRIVWREPRGEGEPVALQADTARLFTRADADPTGSNFRLVMEDGAPVGLQYDVGEEAHPIVSAYLRARAKRELWFVVNGTLHARWEPGPEWDGKVRVASGFDGESVRGFLFAFAGEPFPAPVRFVEFGKRPLLNVRLDGEDPEVVRVPHPGEGPVERDG